MDYFSLFKIYKKVKPKIKSLKKLRGFSPPLVGKVSANFRGYKVSRGQRNESPRPLILVF
jgi:hypothetical protein